MSAAPRPKPLLQVLNHQRRDPPPIWLMRQAGRYLPEYRDVRSQAGSFLNLCYNPALAAEVTLQPLSRFDLDAAIIFSDILVVPQALGVPLIFVEGEGPRLEPPAEVPRLEEGAFIESLQPVYEAISRVAASLPHAAALIGFAGAPWTLACYMLDGQGGGGFPVAVRTMRQQPTRFGKLIDVLVDAVSLHLSAQIEAGAEVVQVFDSWAGLLGEDEVKQWCLAPLLRITAEVARRHPNVPVMLFPRQVGRSALVHLAEDGRAAALSLDQGQDLQWAASALQPRTVVQGNLAPETLLAGGESLERETRTLLEALAGGPHIFNLGHGVLQGTPPEHVAALVAQVRAYSS